MEPQEEQQPLETPASEEPVEELLNSEAEPVEETATEAEAEKKTEPTPPLKAEPAAGAGVKREPLRAPNAKPSLWNRILPWVIVALVFFLGGLATLYFTMYRPLKTVTAMAAETNAIEMTKLNDQIGQLTLDKTQIENDLQTTRDDLVNTQEELVNAKATIEEQLTEVANANVRGMVYKMLTNVNIARAALEQNDAPSARQALTFAKADLAELEGAGVEADVLSGFKDRLNEAVTNLSEEGFATSRAALETLFNNLLLLAKNLP